MNKHQRVSAVSVSASPRSSVAKAKKKAPTKPQFRCGMYMGSFCLPTRGHQDLIRRAAARAERLYVVVAANPAKEYPFTAEYRLAAVQKLVDELGLANVEVVPFSGLAISFYAQYGCDVCFRGIRNEKDRAEEELQRRVNGDLLEQFGLKAMRYAYLRAGKALEDVSSTVVTILAKLGTPVFRYASTEVWAALAWRFRKVVTIGVTGGIACGASSVAKALCGALAGNKGLCGRPLGAYHVDFDALLRAAYDSPVPAAQALRAGLAKRFGADVLGPDGRTVKRDRLKPHLFGPRANPADLQWVIAQTTPLVLAAYYEAVAPLRDAVVIVEAKHAGFWPLALNRLVVVDAPDREAFIGSRQIDPDFLQAVQARQARLETEVCKVEAAVRRAGDGFVIRHANPFRAAGPDVSGLIAELESNLGPFLDEVDRGSVSKPA